MVVTHDGMVVDSLLGKSLEPEVVAAMAAMLTQGTRRAVEQAALGPFESFSLVSTHGKMIVTDTGSSFLVVVLDRVIDLGHAELEIRSAVRKVRNLGDSLGDLE